MDFSAMSQMMSTQEQKASELTRHDKIELRNNKILCDIATGRTKNSICEEYHISMRQLYRIIEQAHEELDDWYNTISKEGMITMFRQNSKKVFKELQRLEELRMKEGEIKVKFDMTKDIINTTITYNKMIAEGPVLTKYRELTDQMKKIVESNNGN